MASMPQDDIRNELLALLETAAVEHDVDIVDVEVVGSAKAPFYSWPDFKAFCDKQIALTRELVSNTNN